MFIEFTTQDNKKILLNKTQIVSIETNFEPVMIGGPRGGTILRIHAVEGRVFTLDPKEHSYDSLRKQIEPQELKNERQDKSSPIG